MVGPMMRRAVPLLLLLLLCACAPPPRLDDRIPAAERDLPPPALVPLGPLLAAADALPASGGFEAALAARAGALTAAPPPPAGAVAAIGARAGALEERAAPATPPASPEAARLEALRARAEALQTGVLTPEEARRLRQGPSLP